MIICNPMICNSLTSIHPALSHPDSDMAPGVIAYSVLGGLAGLVQKGVLMGIYFIIQGIRY
jgi:hypothetical protein